MDELATNIINTFKRSSTPIEAKLSLFNQLKSHIKHQRVPETAQTPTLECVRLAITSQLSSSLVASGFSALGHLIKRLTLQDQMSVVYSSRCNVIPALLERMGDAKESHRQAASQALCDLWPSKPTEIERVVRESAILEGHARAKESGMLWVTKMHAEQGLQFRSFVPHMVGCLEDADSNVREAAKAALVELFNNAPDHAKADLKRQLVVYNVRSSIASHILMQLNISAPSEIEMKSSTQSVPPARNPMQDHGVTGATSEHFTPPPSAEATQIDPLNLYTQRELEDSFREMQPCFEGKESEQNWIPRDKNVSKLRRMVKGNAATEYNAVFVAGIRSLMDGILKVANSLRTTMSTNGCQLVQELARSLGAALDPIVELLLQNFIKMSSATKNITAQQGSVTMEVLLSCTTYHLRHSQQVWIACQDKNATTRIYASGWLKVILKRQMQTKQHFDHSGGLDLAEKSIKKGLADANPKVREGMRSAYWTFAPGWSEKAETIMESLDAKSKQLLERDPSNPHPVSGGTSFTASVGPTSSTNPRAATSLKDAIAARKKAAAAAAAASSRNLPERPSSAMSTFSPVRQTASAAVKANSNTNTRNNMTTQSASKPAPPPPATQSQPSLMSAPVRRPRRPEMTRPATADPYAMRKVIQPTSPNRSPAASPTRPVIRGAQSSMSVLHTSTKAPRSVASDDLNLGRNSRNTSPRVSPTRKRTGHMDAIIAGSRSPVATSTEHSVPSPTVVDDNFTMVIPKAYKMPVMPFRARSDYDRLGGNHAAMARMAEEDNFTLVIPREPTVANSGNAAPNSAQPNVSYTVPILEEQLSREASVGSQVEVPASNDMTNRLLRTQPLPHVPHKSDAGHVDDLIVFEDPTAQDIIVPINQELAKPVLEELPINEQTQLANAMERSENDRKTVNPRRTPSPTKRSVTEPVTMTRIDATKVQRLLSSEVDRIRQGTLDAHGFRQLQEVIRQANQESGTKLADVMLELIRSLEQRRESGDGHVSKASTVQSQTLSTIRIIATSKAGGAAVKDALSRALCAMITVKAQSDGSAMAMELDRTVDAMIKRVNNSSDCMDSVCDFCERDPLIVNMTATGHTRATTMALRVLSRLLTSAGDSVTSAQQSRLGRLAVRCLDDVDAEVRRADTEMCVELRESFGGEDEGAFWATLEGAREAQMNLIAYYIAKRRKTTSAGV